MKKTTLGIAALMGALWAMDYSKALNLSVKFYGAQRSGTADSNWIIKQYPNKAPCFPRDGELAGVDLRGGWHDAGDNIKFTLTNAWSAYVLLKAYDAYPSSFKDQYNVAYGPANGIPDILDEAKWATDYLLKANLNSTTLVSQVGDGSDHDQGMTCVTMTKNATASGGDPRTVWYGNSQTDKTGTKADVLGITAAALALMSKVYQSIDPVYAQKCLSAAQNLYATAKTRQGNTAEPNAQNFYKTSGYQDDLMCGAVELYRATNTASYLNEALGYNTSAGTHNWVVDWNDHHDYCRHSLAKAGKVTEAQSYWKPAVDAYLSKVSQQQFIKGLAFFSDWGSLRYATGAAFSAALYYDAFGGDQYKNFAISQVDYVLGSNEYKRSFLVGYDATSPKAPHHKNAFGTDSWMSTNSVSKYSLDGALVGGPHTNNYKDQWLTSPPGYQDIMTDYIANEVTVDYNSGFVGATAFVLAQQGGQSSSISSSGISSSSVLSSSSVISSSAISSSAVSSSATSSSSITSGCASYTAGSYWNGTAYIIPAKVTENGTTAWSCVAGKESTCASIGPSNNAWNQWQSAGNCSVSSSSAMSSSSIVSSSSSVPQAQSISFSSIQDAYLSVASANLKATASSGLTVSFSSLTKSVCGVSGNLVSFLGTGVCNIEASQSGDLNYAPANNVQQSFTILTDPSSSSIQLSSSNQVYSSEQSSSSVILSSTELSSSSGPNSSALSSSNSVFSSSSADIISSSSDQTTMRNPQISTQEIQWTWTANGLRVQSNIPSQFELYTLTGSFVQKSSITGQKWNLNPEKQKLILRVKSAQGTQNILIQP